MPDSTFLNVAGFEISKFYFGFLIHYCSLIVDSKAVDSGFYRPKLPGFRLPYMGRYGCHEGLAQKETSGVFVIL